MVEVHTRNWDKKSRKEISNQSIEEKTSYRWISSTLSTVERLEGAARITIIGDREIDIYDELSLGVTDERVDLLIRASGQVPFLWRVSTRLLLYIFSSHCSFHHLNIIHTLQLSRLNEILPKGPLQLNIDNIRA